MSLFACGEKPSTNEIITHKNKNETQPAYMGSIDWSYKKYADSINILETSSPKLPDFIVNYGNHLESLESTGTHLSKNSIYSKILNHCDIDKLKVLVSLLDKKSDKNENEVIVLSEAKYLIEHTR